MITGGKFGAVHDGGNQVFADLSQPSMAFNRDWSKNSRISATRVQSYNIILREFFKWKRFFMNELKIFEKKEFGSVRVVMINGEPFFIANDIAKVLEYADPKKAIRMHCKYPKLLKGDNATPFTSSPRGISIIPESDVYRLIMRSHLPSAIEFQDWVVEDVLPSIRKNGEYYLNQKKKTNEEIIAEAVSIARVILAERDAELQKAGGNTSTIGYKNQAIKSATKCFRKTFKGH